MNNVVTSTQDILLNFFSDIVSYLPNVLAGIILLVIGLVIGNVMKKIIKGIAELFMVDELLRKANVEKTKTVSFWFEMFSEIIRWSIIVLFLVAAVEAWGLSQVGALLGQLLVYLPNVFIAAVIGFIGMVTASIVRDLVKHSSKSLGSTSAGMLSTVAWYAVVVFTGLLILNQLGIGAELVKILFTAIVAMIALAGGLAFGLGGQDTAKRILDDLYKKIKN